MPRAPPRARRGRQARRLAGRRLPGRDAGASRSREPFQKPIAMLYRNLLAMETEELLRSLPGRRRGADGRLRQDRRRRCSWARSRSDLPSIFVPAGPMLRGNWRGQTLGSGTDVWKYWAERRAGKHRASASWREIEDGIARSPGHCMTMGTASTMTAAVEALGLTLPGASSIPARRLRARRDGGRVRPARSSSWSGRTSARRTSLDAGGVRERGHRRARARRLHQRGHPPDRHGRPRRACRSTSTLRRALARRRRCSPTSARPAQYLMEDFYDAGGLRGADARARRPARRSTR